MISKNQRLGRKLFAGVWKGGRRITSPLFSVVFVQNIDFTSNRFAVVVPKKVVSSAVNRNKIRRRVYGGLRKYISLLNSTSFSIILIAKSSMADKTYKEVVAEVEKVLNKIFSLRIEKGADKA